MKRFALAGLIGTGILCISVGFLMAAEPERQGGPTATAKVKGVGDYKDISGVVTFTSEPSGVRVVAHIMGLSPGKHGFHIHEKADLTAPDLSSAGPHWNPGGHKHGGPGSADHHAGDLGNITADEKGHATYDHMIKGLTIEGATGVLGHSVIIHEKADDEATDPAGNSGKRIAGGAIVIGEPPKKP